MKKLAFVLLLLCHSFLLIAQLKSPSSFFGNKPGQEFTPHYKVLEYLSYLSSVSGNIKLQQYGKSYEGRPLFLAFIASSENIDRLDQIRDNNLKLSGIESGKVIPEQPAIVWLSYNVHGNEAVSTEAALQTLYYLLDERNADAQSWLRNTIIIIDPCMNPDGRERYLSFYTSTKNINPDPLYFTREHEEPWPGGRSNHYYFDLNRDWAWQTQVETQQRLKVYNSWLPHIHVDFHEQNFNDPYYFAPAAEPFHQDVTAWQREFQTIIGKNNARYFDRRGWLYFTRERFDLLYPSYGDTYPTYNGAVGMTYEQGGSGRAGLSVINREGDTLTLASRIAHHHTSALSTIEASSVNASKVVAEFKKYFENSRLNPSGTFKTYIVKDTNAEKLKSLASLLNKNGIKFGYGASGLVKGFNYLSGKNERFTIAKTDMVINAYQPKSVLLKVLFEPRTLVSDSVTYDITAWALPYAYGLQVYATSDDIKPLTQEVSVAVQADQDTSSAIAYAANWNSLADVKFLASLLKKNIRVRYSEVPFHLGSKKLNAGSLIITKAGNEALGLNFNRTITDIALKAGVVLQPVATGLSDKGPDLGSSKIKFIRKPRIVVVSGEEVNAMAFGEVWHFFEQQIDFPVSVVNAANLNKIKLDHFNVIIIPDGNYRDIPSDKLLSWINEGGKLIAMENAVSSLIGKKGFNLTSKNEGPADKDAGQLMELIAYADRDRESVKTNIPGAIYKVSLDNSHPLGYGFPNYYYSLKTDDKVYSFLNDGWNVGVIKKDSHVTGFVGATTKKKLSDGLLFGVQESGEGSIIYLADNPLFRSFWENGKLLFSNAVFMVGG